MTQYINKSALVAEIERKAYIICQGVLSEEATMSVECFKDSLISFLDTLGAKEQLTWQDVRLISEIGESFMNSEESDHLSEEEYYTEILNRFKAQKGE